VLVSLALPAFAQADPFHLEFNEGYTDQGSQKKVVAINPSTPVTMDGEITGSSFTIPQSGVKWPPQAVTQPLPSTSYTEVNGPLTGTFDALTGAMTLEGSFTFATESTLTGKCTIGPATLAFSTSGTEPYPGQPFTSGTAGPGAIVTKWASLPDPVGGPKCNIVKTLTSSPGGLWIAHNSGPPIKEEEKKDVAPKLKVTVSGAKSVVGGKKAKLTVKVVNNGTGAATSIKVCAQVPKPLSAGGCQKLASLGIGKSTKKTFTVKTKSLDKAKTYTLTFKTSAASLKTLSTKAKLKVKVAAGKGGGKK